MNTLLEQLLAEQNIRQMSDYQFVNFLNAHSTVHVSRQLWHRTRNKNIPIGLTVLKATIQTFPSLNDDVITYLKGKSNE